MLSSAAESIHGLAVGIPTNHREIPGSTPGRYNLQIEITSPASDYIHPPTHTPTHLPTHTRPRTHTHIYTHTHTHTRTTCLCVCVCLCASPTSALSNQLHLFVCCLFPNHFQVCCTTKKPREAPFFFGQCHGQYSSAHRI